MPFLTIAFPVFDPIAIAIGPIAIRWYALAYIGGIVLGWLYARSLIKNEKLWGGPAPITLVQMDDFILWVTLGIILGGRTGYVLFYNLGFFVQHPAEIFELWKGGMSFHGGFLGCVAAVILFCRKHDLPILSLGDITTAVGPIGLFLGRLANFINSELWGRPADSSVPWAMVFPNGGPLPRHPSQLYEAGLEGIALFTILALMIRFGALKRPGLILGSFIAIYGLARIVGEFFREPDPQLGFLWGGPAPITLPQMDDFILWVTLGIILGGRTGYVLFYNLPFFMAHPAEIFELWKGGMSFHGGFLGCVAAVILFCRKNDIPILSLGDITTAVGPIGLFLGRLANFINSELWGRLADASVPWAMVFPNGGPLPRHPSQLYEAGLEGIVLFTILAVMIRFGALRRPGLILGSFIMLYGLARITGEFFREPDPQLGFLWGGLTMGMVLSVPMVIAGAVLIMLAWRSPKRRQTSAESRP